MIKITYPGTNNFSTFAYDGLGRNISIVETTAGSVTSTKQFVLAGAEKEEERDGSGILTKQFFDQGQVNGVSKNFYRPDHIGSIVEMTDSTGSVLSDRTYDSFGRLTINRETVTPDFGYAGYYFHPRSSLSLTLTRAYSSDLGRFLSRDQLDESGGTNLFAYVDNSPTNASDPNGLQSCPWGSDPTKFWGYDPTKFWGYDPSNFWGWDPGVSPSGSDPPELPPVFTFGFGPCVDDCLQRNLVSPLGIAGQALIGFSLPIIPKKAIGLKAAHGGSKTISPMGALGAKTGFLNYTVPGGGRFPALTSSRIRFGIFRLGTTGRPILFLGRTVTPIFGAAILIGILQGCREACAGK